MSNFLAKTRGMVNRKEFTSAEHLAHYILLDLQYNDVCQISLYEPVDAKIIAVDVTPALADKRKVSLSVITRNDTHTHTFVCNDGKKLADKITFLLA